MYACFRVSVLVRAYESESLCICVCIHMIVCNMNGTACVVCVFGVILTVWCICACVLPMGQ